MILHACLLPDQAEDDRRAAAAARQLMGAIMSLTGGEREG